MDMPLFAMGSAYETAAPFFAKVFWNSATFKTALECELQVNAEQGVPI